MPEHGRAMKHARHRSGRESGCEGYLRVVSVRERNVARRVGRWCDRCGEFVPDEPRR